MFILDNSLFLHRNSKFRHTKISKKMESTKSFKDLYEDIWIPKREASKAAAEFIRRCAEITMKSEGTVKAWLCGAYVPDALAQDVLSKEFGIPAEVLFPPKSNENADEKNCCSNEK